MGGYKSNNGEWKLITGETWSYDNWAYRQPDNAYGIEDRLMMYCGRAFGTWNDLCWDGSAFWETFFGIENFGLVCEWEDVESFFTENDDTAENTLDDIKLLALGGADKITNGGSNVTIDGGAGDDTIYIDNGSSNLSVSGGADNDNVTNSNGSNISISGGAGNDSITNNGSEVIIAGDNDNDTILNTGGRSASLDGGDDDDFIYNGQNALYYEDSEGNCHYLEDAGVKSQITQLESAISDTQKKNETAINESIAEIRTEIAQLEKNPPEGLSQGETSELKKNLDYYLKEIDTVKKLYLGTKISLAFLEGISNTVKWLNEVHTTPIDWKKYYNSLPNEERDLAYLKSLVQSGKVKYAEDYVAIKSYLQNTYPDPSYYSKSYTKGKKILEIANSDKSVQQRLNDLGKLLKEKPTVPMKIQVQGASGLELFGFGLSVSEFALNYLNSFEEISEASDAASYADFKDKWDVYQKELKSQLGESKYVKLNLSAMDAIGSGVGIIAGIAAGAGAAAAGATGLALLAPVIGAGLLVTGGTALAKTLYSTSQHKDASFWKTLGNNILPLSDTTYVQKATSLSYRAVQVTISSSTKAQRTSRFRAARETIQSTT